MTGADWVEVGRQLGAETVYFTEQVAMPDSDTGDEALWTFVGPGTYLLIRLPVESPTPKDEER